MPGPPRSQPASRSPPRPHHGPPARRRAEPRRAGDARRRPQSPRGGLPQVRPSPRHRSQPCPGSERPAITSWGMTGTHQGRPHRRRSTARNCGHVERDFAVCSRFSGWLQGPLPTVGSCLCRSSFSPAYRHLRPAVEMSKVLQNIRFGAISHEGAANGAGGCPGSRADAPP
jgi:hypothetical protein